MHRGFGLALVAALLITAGCRTPEGPGALGAGMTEARLSIDDVRAERVLARYRDATEMREGLRGSARVILSGPDFKLNRPQRIVVKRPANLRFEVVGLFDQLAAVLATDGKAFSFYEAGQTEITRGVLTPGLLWDLAKIDLDPEELVGLLLGSPLPSPGIVRAAVWLEPPVAQESASRIAIAFAWPEEFRDAAQPACMQASPLAGGDAACFLSPDAMLEGAEVFVFDADARLVEVRAVEPGGGLRFRAEYADYRPLAVGAASTGATATTLFPNRVTIGSPQLDSEARFEWKRVMLSDDLSDQYFRIPERGSRPGSNRSGG